MKDNLLGNKKQIKNSITNNKKEIIQIDENSGK